MNQINQIPRETFRSTTGDLSLEVNTEHEAIVLDITNGDRQWLTRTDAIALAAWLCRATGVSISTWEKIEPQYIADVHDPTRAEPEMDVPF